MTQYMTNKTINIKENDKEKKPKAKKQKKMNQETKLLEIDLPKHQLQNKPVINSINSNISMSSNDINNKPKQNKQNEKD